MNDLIFGGAIFRGVFVGGIRQRDARTKSECSFSLFQSPSDAHKNHSKIRPNRKFPPRILKVVVRQTVPEFSRVILLHRLRPVLFMFQQSNRISE